MSASTVNLSIPGALPESSPRACSHLWQDAEADGSRCASCGERASESPRALSQRALREQLAAAREKIVALQERIAHAERARDNAIASRDEAQQRSKEKGQRAAEEIARLKQEGDALRQKVSDMYADRLAAQMARITAIIEKA